MPAAKTPTVKNLEALGAARLAELLIAIGAGDPAIKRRLRLELAGQAGAADAAREIQKRLSTLAKSTSYIEWNRIKPLSDDLTAHHRAIVDVVAKADPRQALDLLWRFMELVDPIMSRCDDSNGRLASLFRSAAEYLAPLAVAAEVGPDELARNVFGALHGNGYGQFDDLIADMAGALGPSGLASLKQRFVDWGKEAPEQPAQHERRIVGYGAGGPLYADQLEASHRDYTIQSALRDIADAEDDVDGFIAQHGAEARRAPAIAVEIAGRLLKAGRADEALAALEAVDRKRLGWAAFDWQQGRLDALDALGRIDDAQAFRWTCFAETLESRHLRAHLKALPDFDDIEAEERAMALALGFPDVHGALNFLIAWPALDRANALILARFDELNGDFYELLAPASEALDVRYPLAATLIRRAMIDFTLTAARSKRYPHAARHLADCGADAVRIDDFGQHPTHEDYQLKLKTEHGRKVAFWQSVHA
ncbi:MAG TPA: hypothetical protein VGI79_18945 [Caulobacteraceae bacterium]|jgi:hypothetical protein